MSTILFNKTTGRAVAKGDTIKSFRGIEFVVLDWHGAAPPSTGRVYVRPAGPDHADAPPTGYYPSVFDCEIRDGTPFGYYYRRDKRVPADDGSELGRTYVNADL